jgi:hypothetical protein
MIRHRLTPPPAIPPASDILDKAEASHKSKPRTHQGCFAKGNTLHINRRLRGPNKFTRVLREAALLAMEAVALKITRRDRLKYHGVTSYLEWVAEKEPSAFLSFVARAVVPVQVKHDLSVTDVIEVRFRKIEEVKLEFEKRGLPLPKSTFELEHHASIEDAAASPKPDAPAPAPAADRTPQVSQPTVPVQVLPPTKPRLPAHLERFSVTPGLYREDLQ